MDLTSNNLQRLICHKPKQPMEILFCRRYSLYILSLTIKCSLGVILRTPTSSFAEDIVCTAKRALTNF